MVGPTTVEVNGEQYSGENLVLATGSYEVATGLEIGGRIMTSIKHSRWTTYPASSSSAAA